MIIGSFSNWTLQKKVEHPVIVEAIERLKQIADSNPEPGRIEVQGDAIYANVMTFEAKEAEQLLAEKHEQYIDIHCVLEGEEIIGWSPEQEEQKPEQLYNEEQDYALYTAAEDELQLVCKPGQFIILYPFDIHRPGMGKAGTTIKKVVMKLKLDMLQ